MDVGRRVTVLVAVAVLAGTVGCSAPPTGPGSTRGWAPDFCPPPPDRDQATAIDWVPFVVLDGVTYSTDYSPGSVVADDQVGEVVGSVRCRVEDVVFDPEFVPREGDSAYLPIGTEVHAVVGSPVATSVTAREDGVWRLYDADQPTPGHASLSP